MKKLLSYLVAFALVVSLVVPSVTPVANAAEPIYVAQTIDAEGNVVKQYESLGNALGSESEGLTVQLLTDLTLDKNISTSKSMTIDLNGHSITNTKRNYALRIYRAKNKVAPKVTIKDTVGGGAIINTTETDGTNGLAIAGDGTEVVVTSGVFISGYHAADIKNSGKLVIEDAKLQGEVAGVAVWGDENEADGFGKSTLEVKGGTISGAWYGIAGNGSTEHGETSITVSGGVITATKTNDSTGIYHPQNGTLAISGGKISGVTGVEIRAGELAVSGDANIVGGTGEIGSASNGGDGSTAKNIGIAIAQHTTKKPIAITINGGTISGSAAVYASNPENNPVEDLAEVKATINKGTFIGTVMTEGGGEVAVTGGAFTDLDDSVKVEAKDEAKVTIDGKTTLVLGVDNINEFIKNAPEGTKVEITKASEDAKFVAPIGTTIENKTGSEITVNEQTVEDGKVVEVKGDPTNPTDPEPENPQDKPTTDKPSTDSATDDKKTESPKTGDDTMVIGYAVIMLAALGVGGTLAVRKRKN